MNNPLKTHLSHTIMSFAVTGLILSISMAIANILAKQFDIPESIVVVLGGFVSVAVVLKVPVILETWLFERQAAYRRALVDADHQLLDTLTPKEAATVTLEILQESIRSDKTAIYIKDAQSRDFTPRAYDGVTNLNVPMQANHPFVKCLQRLQTFLLRVRLPDLIAAEREPRRLAELNRAEEMFKLLDISIVVPLLINGKLVGLMLLGERPGNAPYDDADLKFLHGLSNKAAVVFDNARIHQQSLEFGKKMKSAAQQASYELKMAHEQLTNLDRAKSDFLSIASHQLYTPLTALRGYLSMLVEGDYGMLAPEQRPVVNILDKSISRLIGEIRDLLDVSAIESGRIELDLESIDLVLFINGIMQEIAPQAADKGLKIYFDHTSQALHIVADRARLRQVIYNFIDNAIKYSNKGHVKISAGHEGDNVVFAVTDTGKGLSRSEIPLLFTKFSRAQDAAHYYTEGAGLGLYVAQQIIRAHRGDISVESAGHNKGSTFTVRLPVEGSPAALKIDAKAYARAAA